MARDLDGGFACGESYLTEDEDNAWISAFATGVSAFPVVGSFIAGMIPPSANLNSTRCIPGEKHNETTGYSTLTTLLGVALVLIVVYVLLRVLK